MRLDVNKYVGLCYVKECYLQLVLQPPSGEKKIPKDNSSPNFIHAYVIWQIVVNVEALACSDYITLTI